MIPNWTERWTPETEFQRLRQDWDPAISYRSIMRVADGAVWCAPLGTPDPWTTEDADQWLDMGQP